jgi:hypothetical protein
MPSTKRGRPGDGDGGDGDGGSGGGCGQVVLGVPGRPGCSGQVYNDTNVIVMASDNKRHKRDHYNCNNTDNSIVESVAIESSHGNIMPSVSEATHGINDGANVIGRNNNLESGGNKLVSTGIISLVPKIDQNSNTNTTSDIESIVIGAGNKSPPTDTATSVYSLNNNDEYKDVGDVGDSRCGVDGRSDSMLHVSIVDDGEDGGNCHPTILLKSLKNHINHVTLGGGGEVCSKVNDDINRDTYSDNDNDMEAVEDRDGGNGDTTNDEDSEEEISTNEKLGRRNAVLYSRAKDDLLLSLAICCHFNHLTLPEQYKRLFTQSDNITPEMIIERFNLSDYDIERFHQYLKGNPRRHTHNNNSTVDVA